MNKLVSSFLKIFQKQKSQKQLEESPRLNNEILGDEDLLKTSKALQMLGNGSLDRLKKKSN